MDTSLRLLYRDDWIRKCLGVAGYTCLVYNHALTFDKEVEFIWRAPWTSTKAVFLLNRYGNLICQTSLQFIKVFAVVNHPAQSCEVPRIFLGMYAVFATESVHILVLLRAWAIWGCRRRVAMMLIGSYAIYVLFYLVQAVLDVVSITSHTFKYADLHEVCVMVMPPNMWILGFVNACQDTIAFGATMISLWQHSRNSQNLYPTSLFVLLVRDAITFYVTSISCNIFNTLTCIFYPPGPYSVLSVTFVVNLVSIAGQRLVLNLRGFTVRTYGSRSLSAEVDRQLEMLTGTQRLEWWSSGVSRSNISRVGDRQRVDGDIEMDGLSQESNRRSGGEVGSIMTTRENIDVES